MTHTDTYETFLDTAVNLFQNDLEARAAFRLILQAWMVGEQSFDQWAIMPFLHPIKLQWWYARLSHYNRLIKIFISPDQDVQIVDEKVFKRDLYAEFQSNGYPSVVTLPNRDQQCQYLLPVAEVRGYELFGAIDKANIAYGLDAELLNEDDSQQELKITARELARVIEDYVETYPFVRDGLEIYLLNCRNGALPGMLLDAIQKITNRRKWSLQINLIVHTEHRGAPLYRRVVEWIEETEDYADVRSVDSYFPSFTIKVLECPIDEVGDHVEDTDIVILADVLAEKGQRIRVSPTDSAKDVTWKSYLHRFKPVPEPQIQKSLSRYIAITPDKQPRFIQWFYDLQWGAHEQKPVEQNYKFELEVTLSEWEKLLQILHSQFNWVICYDPTIDRHLIEARLGATDEVDIIKYAMGLGQQQRHNLTVSSSKAARTAVEKRLTAQINSLVPDERAKQQQIAVQLVHEANQISGDIILRAAGPGLFLNELIGITASKRITEAQIDLNDVLYTWIYLDDFAHWFERKMPDLLFVAIQQTPDQQFILHIQVIESKCVNETSFAEESSDAQKQLFQGVNRLEQAWHPDFQSLDKNYWYDQLYRAVVSNLPLDKDHLPMWQAFREAFDRRDFHIQLTGHTWVFCYDGSVGAKPKLQGAIASKTEFGTPLTYHHYGSGELKRIIRSLIGDETLVAEPSALPTSVEGLVKVKQSTFTVDATRSEEVQQKQSTEVSERVSSDEDEDDAHPGWVEETAHNGEQTTPNLAPWRSFEEARNRIDDRVSQEVTDYDTESSVTVPADDENSVDSELHTWLEEKARELRRAMRDFGVETRTIRPEHVDIGPSIIRFKIELRPGEKTSKLEKIDKDLQRVLALDTVPIIQNISGTRYVGIDLPHPDPSIYSELDFIHRLHELEDSYLPFLVGTTPNGRTHIADFEDLKHLLVAGSTGSGKTIFLYSILVSLISQFGPEELSLIIIDPKQTDFIFFDKLPHILGRRVIIEPETAIEELRLLTEETLQDRTNRLRDAVVRDIREYNAKYPNKPIAPIVVMIDEYADLVQVLGRSEREEFERQMTRLAQRARNVGIHLIVATQRPSADIVTPKLKTNLPGRVAFRLPSYHDSNTILDESGAENLIGRGDMLFKAMGYMERLQGFFISTENLVNFLDERKS